MGECMNEQIDVLLATYNGDKFLKEQIDSILNQTYQDIRLVISDDMSRDSTRDIIRAYEKKDKRVEVHLQKENLGYIKNFEYLLKQVKNNIYMLSDQDDVWLPDKIEQSYLEMQKENADLVFGDLRVVNEKLETIYESFGDFMKLNRKISKCFGTQEMNYLYNCVTGCTILSKKKYIDSILPLPNKSKYVAHDHWIALAVGKQGKLVYMPECHILYRQHENNEIGTDKISHGFTKVEEVRDLFIRVKLGVFETYVQNDKVFSENMKAKNRKALLYFRRVNGMKSLNFRGWSIFHELYKNETLVYYLENFLIMNMPALAKPLFYIRRFTLKALRKK